MNDVNAETPSNEWEQISADSARAWGVGPGHIPRNRRIGAQWLREAARRESWCSPLVIAGPHEVFDFTKGYEADRELKCLFGIGRYDEDRVGMYEAELFRVPESPLKERRTLHVGLDIGAAEGTPIFSPAAATIVGSDYLAAVGDYGGAVILKIESSRDLYILFGHLSKATVARCVTGDKVSRGELLGWLAGKSENGGWNPHLHWQFSWLRPLKVDLPGAVRPSDRDFATRLFSDPSVVLDLAAGGARGT